MALQIHTTGKITFAGAVNWFIKLSICSLSLQITLHSFSKQIIFQVTKAKVQSSVENRLLY